MRKTIRDNGTATACFPYNTDERPVGRERVIM